MASRAASSKSKSSPKKASAKAAKTSAKSTSKAKAGGTATRSRRQAEAATPMPRATSSVDDDGELLLSGAARAGTVFGRCGGRILSTRIEQQVCDLLSRHGVTHSHAPRHFEVRFDDQSVAAYAPMIVLRVRGREGKTVVLEAADSLDESTLGKIKAFRKQYGIEFYVCMIAPEEILDEIPISAYDEAATTEFAQNLISRLAD